MGVPATAGMALVAVAWADAAIGLWRGAWWGRCLAMSMLAINGVGDILNATVGHDPRAWIGVPITGFLLVYLWRFRAPDRAIAAETI